MERRSAQRVPWWVRPAIAAVALVAFAAAFFLSPTFNVLVRTASSVLRGEEPAAVRILIVTRGDRSPLAAMAMIVWQALAFPLSDVPALRASGLLWGPVLGSLVNWLGLLAAASLAFAFTRALIGVPIEHFFPRTVQPLGIARRVILGLRLIPVVPQDLVSLFTGTTRTRFVDFILATAVGLLPPALLFAIFPEEVPAAAMSAVTVVGTTVGVSLLAYVGWRYRTHIPWGSVSAERKRTLIVSAVLLAAAASVYSFVPSFRASVDSAVAIIASGDISAVRDYLLGFGVWAPVVSALLMVLQSIAAPLPAFVITFSNGMLFGWAWGALLSWSSAMAGAALCFWISRAFGRPVVEKLVGGSTALGVSDLFFNRYGDRAVLIARLLPFVSFDIVSYGAGLTSMRFWPFFWATGLGQLPATLVYSYLGQNLTGSVRVLFIVFVITTAIFVGAAGARPYFMRRLEERREAGGAASSESAE